MIGVSLYDFDPQVAMIPEYTYAGVYGRARHEINNHFYAFAEFSLRQNNTHYEQAATPVTATAEQGNATKWRTATAVQQSAQSLRGRYRQFQLPARAARPPHA